MANGKGAAAGGTGISGGAAATGGAAPTRSAGVRRADVAISTVERQVPRLRAAEVRRAVGEGLNANIGRFDRADIAIQRTRNEIFRGTRSADRATLADIRIFAESRAIAQRAAAQLGQTLRPAER